LNRRKFISQSALFSGGLIASGRTGILHNPSGVSPLPSSAGLYELFCNPSPDYHPFVRWWWNGNKVEAGELIRELRLLKDAGIGGVEINPVEFPSRSEGDDLGLPSLVWLSDEWIEMLRVVFAEAKSLGITCDLIVGSGWPFGAEYLEGEERSQIAVIAVKKLKGPIDYEISRYEIFREADPAVSSPFPGRTMELLSLKLVPEPLSSIEQVVDLNGLTDAESIKIKIPEGRHALCGLVRINAFMQVINGAPGATGPVLNHYNKAATERYLNNMSGRIEKKCGPLSNHIRALFTDSMELEGANWSEDMMEEFRKRKGYDIFPFLPFLLFKTGGMGNVTDFKYGVSLSPEFEEMIRRMRYDFEMLKAELLEERFTGTYVDWCRGLKVKSRAQAYGRSFFPLEGSFEYDIPECETWTMNWLKHRIGEEMPESDYRRGRAYTMINKYVSSAANLKGKRLVSCEENTDTYTVFNTTLEFLKAGGDQSTISGVTHPVFHGFNYSPPEAPYPGWIRYGGYYNENNTWWPWFNLYNEYKARLSAVLQNVTMFADIAILPPNDDMWSLIGSQMEPFPNITHADYMTLVWEAINKNGSGCDYVSQRVIREAEMKKGYMLYGPRKYHTLFLIQVDSLDPVTAKKLFEFVNSGGRVFCVEAVPSKSPGWKDHQEKDAEVMGYVKKMQAFPDRFIFLKKPEKDFIGWYSGIQEKYGLKPYVKISSPDPFVMQNRYRADDGSEVFYIINSHIHNSHPTRLTFSVELTGRKYGWIWDPETGERSRIYLSKDNGIDIDLGPAQSLLFVFDKNKDGPRWDPLPSGSPDEKKIETGWSAEFRHCRDGSVKHMHLDTLKDIKDMPDFMNFAGTVVYRNTINIDEPRDFLINTGKVYGLAELKVNGKECGVRWYGRRIFRTGEFLKQGDNEIEIIVATTMGNYMKSLTDNPVAQYWTNEKNKIQPLQSMGLLGPVSIY